MKKKLNITVFIVMIATYAILLALNWIWLCTWLGDNVMPLYGYIDCYEWGNKCSVCITILIVVGIILNIYALIRASFYRKPNIAWRNWFIIFSVLTVIIPIVLGCLYPLDSGLGIYLLIWFFCVLTCPVAFFIITYFAPYQLGFNPFKK